MSRVTIKSIANDLGISHMTVSRALANSPKVQKETRAAVQKRARELGYVKSAVAMVMRGDAPKIVGLLLPNIVNEFYARFANDMAAACDAQSQQLIIHLTNDDLTAQQQALDRLQEVQAASVVMVPALRHGNEGAPFAGTMRVIELIRQDNDTESTAALLVDDGPAINEAVTHLANAGHKDIAYIGANHELSSGRNRLNAFLRGAEAAGLNVAESLIRTGVPTFAMGRSHAKNIIDSGTATAMVCGGFEISNGVLSAVLERSNRTTQEIAFIGYGDPSFYDWVDNGVSTIQVPVTELAERAAKMVALEAGESAASASFAARLILR